MSLKCLTDWVFDLRAVRYSGQKEVNWPCTYHINICDKCIYCVRMCGFYLTLVKIDILCLVHSNFFAHEIRDGKRSFEFLNISFVEKYE